MSYRQSEYSATKQRGLVQRASLAFAGVGGTILLLGLGAQTTAAADYSSPQVSQLSSIGARYGAQPATALRYPVPPGAYFVSPSGSNSGSGRQSSPWRTVAKAVSSAPSGSTIVLRAGTYHESVTWYRKTLTLQPYPGERAVFDGSVPVTGWVADSSTLWHVDGWKTTFKQGGRPDLVYNNSLAAYPDMVFRDGIPLRQVGSLSQVVADSFYVDRANERLYVGSSPTGRAMAASTLSRALYLNYAQNSMVRGITFQRYATHPDLVAAVLGTGKGLFFENNIFRHNAAIGLSDMSDDSTITNNTFAYNGQMGLHSHETDNVVIRENWMHHNNTERFKLPGAQGGLKVTAGSNHLWVDNLSEQNYGCGLWLDRRSHDVTIARNVVRDNSFRGIKAEVSARVIIASNLVLRNKTYGILDNESNGVRIWNNTLVLNGRGIQATDSSRRSSDTTFPADVKAMAIRNNIVVDANAVWPKPPALLAIEDFTRTRTGSQMGVTADYNAYYRTGTAPQTLVMWARSGGTSLFADLAEFRRRTGQEVHGLGFNRTPAPFVDPAAGNYRVRLGSPPALAGKPLPPDIAAAIGVPSGVPVDMGILQ